MITVRNWMPLGAVVVAIAVVGGLSSTPSYARGGDHRDSPMFQNHQGDLLALLESRRPRYRCNWSDGKCPNPPEPTYPRAEPGSLWRLVSPCDWLADTGVSCYLDPYIVDDNN